MRSVNLASVDLNLLVVVAAVLEERSATRGAKRLRVTQSAVSNALRRARDVFDDALVTREPHGLSPTHRGATLIGPLRAWLEDARGIIGDAPSFDASTSTRTFTIACSDAVAISILGAIVRALRVEAPSSKLRLLTLDRLLAGDALARGDADLLVGIPPVLAPGHEAELAYRDPLACIVRKDHPRVRSRLDLRTFSDLPHVDVALFGSVDDRVDRALARRGRSRVVSIALPHFASIPIAIVETDAVATVSARLARAWVERFPIRVLKPPVPFAPIEVRQVWHRRAEADPAHAFLRRIVRDAATTT